MNIIIINEDNSIGRVYVNEKEIISYEHEAEKIGGIIYNGEIPEGPIKWDEESKTVITDDDMILKLQKTKYQRLRKAEYNKLNQDEMRYDDMVNGTNTWGEAIEAIKEKYPKPE